MSWNWPWQPSTDQAPYCPLPPVTHSGSQLLENVPAPYPSSFPTLLRSFHLLLAGSLFTLPFPQSCLCDLAFRQLPKETSSCWSCWPPGPITPFTLPSFLDCSCWGACLRAHPNSEVTPAGFLPAPISGQPKLFPCKDYFLFFHSCPTLGFETQSWATRPPPSLISRPFHAGQKSAEGADSVLCFHPRGVCTDCVWLQPCPPVHQGSVSYEILLPNSLQEWLIKKQIQFLCGVKPWRVAYG